MTTSTIEPIDDELPVDQNPIPAPVPIPEPGPEATPVLDGQELVSFSKKYPQEEPLNQLDGADLRTLLRSAFDWLAHHQEMINRLNVFPVPDGDTGTNMLLTVRSAWAEIVKRGGQSASSVMKAAADGAHQGSRGNSGVILGRIFQGMSEALSEVPHMTQENLMAAMRSATEKAYKSVPTPVEGTILTVVREISAAADRAGQRKDDLRAMLAH
ncbi:MAG: DAK2 domain-containing protein, partial [Caldilineaceae bacterium]|nr:DAK2 domain-containing protein [Caldilineaceae bacterium]